MDDFETKIKKQLSLSFLLESQAEAIRELLVHDGILTDGYSKILFIRFVVNEACPICKHSQTCLDYKERKETMSAFVGGFDIMDVAVDVGLNFDDPLFEEIEEIISRRKSVPNNISEVSQPS